MGEMSTTPAEDAREDEGLISEIGSFFTFLEWAVILGVALSCCLCLCSLCIWRRAAFAAAAKEEDAHNLKANLHDDDELEMGDRKHRLTGPVAKSLEFDYAAVGPESPATAGATPSKSNASRKSLKDRTAD